MLTRKRSSRTLLVVLLALAALAADGPAEDLLIPLGGTEPVEGAPPPDLGALTGWLDDARVVGLGESVHGVHEFRRLAHRIFAHLVETQGFTVFALEINQAHAARLNEFVEGRRDDLDALLAERWWPAAIFYDQSLRELLVWMRQYNTAARRPVHFAGFDFKQPSFAMDAVVDGLARLDPTAAAEARTRYSAVRHLPGLGVYPNVYGFSGALSIQVPPRTGTKTLRIRLQTRGQGFSHGWVGLSLHGAPGSRGPAKSLYLTPDKLSAAWTPLVLEADVADDVDEVTLVLFHRGNGTVWFDGLTIDLDGRPLDTAAPLERVQAQPLEMPGIQSMDYAWALDDEVAFAGGKSLRVACDPAVDDALQAARDVDALVRRTLTAESGRLTSAQATWLQQMSRLVLQATEYRVLVETNRDLFMAENVAWLQEQGFPDSRVLVLAHSSHTNRQARGKGMGLLLDRKYGTGYRTVTLLALAGQYTDFGDPQSLTPDSEPELFSIETRAPSSLEQQLARLGEGDLMFHLEGVDPPAGLGDRMDLASVAVGDLADVAILLRNVRPSALTLP